MIERIIDNIFYVLFWSVFMIGIFFSDTTVLHEVTSTGEINNTYFLSRKDCNTAQSLIVGKKTWCSTWGR